MAPFDAQAILDAVDAGTAPDTWKVYRAQRSYFFGWGISLWGLALTYIFCCAVIILLVFPLSSHEDVQSRLLLALLGIVCSLFAYAFAWQGFVLLRQIPSAPKQVLILTPDGFVVRTGPQAVIPLSNSSIISPTKAWAGTKGGRIFSVTYDNIASTALRIAPRLFETDINLMLTCINPLHAMTWRIDNRFPDTDTIAQSIIEAHTRYTAQHTQTQ